MIKYKKIKFINHEILGNLSLDFTLPDGSVAETVILAGENGTGKSNILEILYSISSKQNLPNSVIEYELENDSLLDNKILKYTLKKNNYGQYENRIIEPYFPIRKLENNFSLKGIFSDVSINFNGNSIKSVTSQNLDTSSNSKKSNFDITNQINQLIVDIQALDDSELAQKFRKAKGKKELLDNISVEGRLTRFTKAFDYMFEDLKYEGIENLNNNKTIIFSKNGKKFTIDKLSSGEKQIVYRGCFLLKDINSMKGAMVFIDEPEISLHPIWQEKIMGFYRNIFKDENGKQTSQIFAVTHSPFVIHDETLDKTKIIILKRNENGEIIVSNEHKYYKCGSIETIKEAFNISDFNSQKNYVFLEGRTDEKYFKKTVEVFGHNNLPFEFKWIGHIENNGQEANTGSKPLNNAYNFLIDKFPNSKHICLYDCDTNIRKSNCKNIYKEIMPFYSENYEKSRIKKGIENSLKVDKNITKDFYIEKQKEEDDGGINIIQEFKKMDFCDYICSLPHEQLKEILIYLNEEILRLIEIFQNS